MRILLVAAVAVGAAGCSIFFDPAKAAVGCSPSTCPAFSNATARCEAGACVYACATGFFDENGDLNATASVRNGCERACSAAPPPALHALVGNPSNGVRWLWDIADGGTPSAFKLCTGSSLAQLTDCQTIGAQPTCAQATDGFQCSALTTGHPNDLRLYGRVQVIDACGTTGPEATAPVRAVSPFDGTLLSLKPNGAGGDSPCDAGFQASGDALQITQPASCLSALTFGDNGWTDFTLRGEIKLPDVPSFAGFAFHYPDSMPKTRSSLMLTPVSTEIEFNVALTYLSTTAFLGLDRYSATSISPVTANQWLGAEVIASNGEVAAAVGPPGNPKPTLRWLEPVQGLGGRFGVYLLTDKVGASVEFRNVTVSTKAQLPPRGPSSLKMDFTGGLPSPVRVVPVGGNVSMKPCNTFPEAAGCDGGCAPAPTSRCIEITQVILGKGALAFDQPLGLDPTQPWRLSFKFAAPAPNGNNAHIVRTLSAVIGKGSILRGPPNQWLGVLSSFGTATTATFDVMRWNKVEYRFTKDSYTLDLNGKRMNLSPLFPPADVDAHLGAFILGGDAPFLGGNIQGQWTDIEIAQPP